MQQTLAIRAGRLLDADAVEKTWAAEFAVIRQLFLAMPNAYAEQLHAAAVNEGVPGVVRLLGEMVHEVLTQVSDPNRAPMPPRPAPEAA
jgi:hypothetical protein